MGLVLDSSVAIAAERRNLPVEGLLELVRGIAGPTEMALSVISVISLEHGVWRAKDETRAIRRRQFLDDLIGNVPVYPITTELARKAGRIDAEQQERGMRIAFQDLLIGVSAVAIGYGVLTSNLRHFQMIPGLVVRQL